MLWLAVALRLIAEALANCVSGPCQRFLPASTHTPVPLLTPLPIVLSCVRGGQVGPLPVQLNVVRSVSAVTKGCGHVPNAQWLGLAADTIGFIPIPIPTATFTSTAVLLLLSYCHNQPVWSLEFPLYISVAPTVPQRTRCQHQVHQAENHLGGPHYSCPLAGVVRGGPAGV
jgi:hypothetical protein